MEAMRLKAAQALGKKEEDIRMPHDLVSVMNLNALCGAIGNNVSIMTGGEVRCPSYTLHLSTLL